MTLRSSCLVVPACVLILAGVGCSPNSRPDVPVLSGTRNCTQGRSYLLGARLSDPDGDSIRLEVAWPDSAAREGEGFVPSGFTVLYDRCWPIPGRYLVRARAWDAHGAGSDWSDDYVVRVYVPDSLPLTPSSLRSSGAVHPGLPAHRRRARGRTLTNGD